MFGKVRVIEAGAYIRARSSIMNQKSEDQRGQINAFYKIILRKINKPY